MQANTILIVEDNPVNMELVTDLLEVAGYTVLQAENAELGIELALEEQPSLILMDIALPGMDGLTATTYLRRNAGTCAIPIIALTAHAMKGDEQKALDIGCVGYITKPLDTRKFLPYVAGFLVQKAVNASLAA